MEKANQQIEVLKTANRKLAEEKEREGKALRKYIYEVEKKLRQWQARSVEDIVPLLRDAFKDAESDRHYPEAQEATQMDG